MKKRVLDAAPPSPRHRMTKRTRHAFTAKEKLHWLAMLDSRPDLSIRGLARLAKVQPKQIHEWKRLKERLEVEVLEDVLEEAEDGPLPNPFYEDPADAPEPAATEGEEEEEAEPGLDGEADGVDAAAEGLEAASLEEEEDEADEVMGEADEWSDDGEEWWAPGRFDGQEVEEWVAGQE
ncbi:unnamed protein product [Closterium sp. Naga37s-1]|nr:unnamed protein product [Closterium sp. Naga37s-1]